MTKTEELIKIYQQLEDAGLMVIAGKKDSAELMVSHDVVPVVRCQDCKFYMTIHCICDGCCISDDWYCAGGERRTDAKN